LCSNFFIWLKIYYTFITGSVLKSDKATNLLEKKKEKKKRRRRGRRRRRRSLNPRGCDASVASREKSRRQSSSMQNAWMRRRILPRGSLAFYRTSRGLSTRASRLAYRVALEYALRVPISRASRFTLSASSLLVYTYIHEVHVLRCRVATFSPAYHQTPDPKDPEEPCCRRHHWQ